MRLRVRCSFPGHPDPSPARGAGGAEPRPAAVKDQFRTASILKGGRVVFNLARNKYRLVVWINYPYRVVYIRFIGTHRQYDAIDAQTI